jgi:hypothetical protein
LELEASNKLNLELQKEEQAFQTNSCPAAIVVQLKIKNIESHHINLK